MFESSCHWNTHLTNTIVREKIGVLRIILQPTTLEIPFKFIFKKNPMKVGFVMTIKKSLGQFVKYVSLDLWTFSHNQFVKNSSP
jgi:hypothetical protein